MSADDRFEEIKRLLDSTINEFQTLFESAGGFEDSRVGNGWNPEKIAPEIYHLQPKPLEELSKIAEAHKRSLFKNRVLSFVKPKEQDVLTLVEPRLKLVPFWRIKGYHECFYFRGNSYKIDLPEDVVAVEVEGKIRDLLGQESVDAQSLANLAKRLLGRKEWSAVKSIRLGDVTELAYMYREGSIFVDAEGKENLEAEAFFDRNLPLQKIGADQLAKELPGAELGKSSITKEDLVRKLHAMVVKPPSAFSKILSNRYQITELAEYLMPVYSFIYEWRGQRKELTVHGYTGGIFQ
ncbi:MAG: hypothetical protein ABSA50_10820 [Candidatus Bathyarchaeia archaeon]